MVAVGAARDRDAAHINQGLAWSASDWKTTLGRNLAIIGEFRRIHLLQLLAAESLNADRDGLQVFGPLLRGHDDFLQLAAATSGCGLVLRQSHRRATHDSVVANKAYLAARR